MRALFFLWVVQGYAAFSLTWGTPAISLDSNPSIGDTDANATIAVDPFGNAVATWSRTTGKGASEDIWASVYNHSSRIWTGAFKISGGGSASHSQVAIDGEGNALLTWEEGFPTQIMYRILSAEGVWTPPLAMPPSPVQFSVNAQTSPQIALDSAGNALAIWAEYIGRIYHVLSAKKPFGQPWQNLGEITTGQNSAAFTSAKAISMNESGDAIAVWQEVNKGFFEVHGARYMGGAWTPPMPISEEKNSQFPSAGIDRLGNVVIVWNQDNMILSKTLNNGVLSSTYTISNPAYISLRPDIGVDPDGNAVVVFERYDVMHKYISGATFTANRWTMPIDISGPSPAMAAGAGYPVLSLNALGDGVVIWKESTGTNMVIQGAGYALGTWSFIKTLSSLSGNSGAPVPAYDIDVAVNSAGNIIAIWPEDPRGSGALQIKSTTGAGLAIAGPQPPVKDPITILNGVAFGRQELHRFPAHGDLINFLNWNTPGGVDHYKIYRNSFSSLIGTSKTPSYEDHQRIPGQKEIYLITSVDSNGQESGPITLIVQPKK